MEVTTRRAAHAKKAAELRDLFTAAVLAGEATAQVPTPGLEVATRPIGELLLDCIDGAQLVAFLRSAATGGDMYLESRLLLSVLAQRFAEEHADYAIEQQAATEDLVLRLRASIASNPHLAPGAA
jgi:hypothetical protein